MPAIAPADSEEPPLSLESGLSVGVAEDKEPVLVGVYVPVIVPASVFGGRVEEGVAYVMGKITPVGITDEGPAVDPQPP
ncbi:uncharacterized protein N7496_011998 [Penicillium cataractarum]|uniref:Uncharacterized protein n=1 Tax=Penicillium cataractarum TaxID=2100454 RepID=A0A9W9RG48_9EURO|nr:uncharacterized protein N7496_011998 [Penicillium cataractarum]KAJ5359585.1 hypothetical protein N7496_011998 [Penicillium cataractarum]